MINIIANSQLLITNYLITHSPLIYLTQSLWRDEAFSVLLSEKRPLEIIRLTTQDFNPPFYYLLLHFWMRIFGQSEIAVRMLSFLFHILLAYVCYKFAQKIFKPRVSLLHRLPAGKAGYIVTLLLFNPMLLYYAFEARMYSLLALLATLSMYHFHQKNWQWYIIFTTLGLYTQPFMIFIPLTQLGYLIFTSKLTVRTIKLLITPFILYLPWSLIIFNQVKQSGESWIHSVDLRLISSSLGNLFLGFEGNPPYLWNWTKIVSLGILIFSLKALKTIDFGINKKRPSLKYTKSPTLLFFLWVFLPLFFTLLISIFKPIYVNRYLIFVTIAEIFLIILGIENFKTKYIKIFVALLFCCFVVLFNFWFAPFHKKKDFRKTMTEINQLIRSGDIILASSPLSFFEISYYAEDRSLCYLLNKEGKSLPPYIGRVLISQNKMMTELPYYPKKAFLVDRGGIFEIVSRKLK